MPDGSVRYVKSEKDPQARKALKPRGRSGSGGVPDSGGVLENLPARKGQEKTSERPCKRHEVVRALRVGPAVRGLWRPTMPMRYEHIAKYGNDAPWTNVVWTIIGILCAFGLVALPFIE